MKLMNGIYASGTYYDYILKEFVEKKKYRY